MFPSLFKNIDVEFFHCEVCEFAKLHRVSFPLSNTRSLSPFSLIHSDIWGPSRISNISGAKGFVTFIDDCTRMTWVYLLKQKSDVSRIFQIFFSMIKTHLGISIRGIRTDNAREYFNQTLSHFLRKKALFTNLHVLTLHNKTK